MTKVILAEHPMPRFTASEHPKELVESCHVIRIGDFRRSDLFRADRKGSRLEARGFVFETEGLEGGQPRLVLLDWVCGRIPIPLTWWRPHFGGKAWMFRCGCGVRSRTLYLPHSRQTARAFRCRRCWKLAYLSSRQAHRWERGARRRIMASIAANREVPIEAVIYEYRRIWRHL